MNKKYDIYIKKVGVWYQITIYNNTTNKKASFTKLDDVYKCSQSILEIENMDTAILENAFCFGNEFHLKTDDLKKYKHIYKDYKISWVWY